MLTNLTVILMDELGTLGEARRGDRRGGSEHRGHVRIHRRAPTIMHLRITDHAVSRDKPIAGEAGDCQQAHRQLRAASPRRSDPQSRGAASIKDRLHAHARSFGACSNPMADQTLRRFCNRSERAARSMLVARLLLGRSSHHRGAHGTAADDRFRTKPATVLKPEATLSRDRFCSSCVPRVAIALATTQ